MKWLIKTLQSSLGRKLVMALTGLFLTGFLLVHLSGNFLLFADDGGESFNAYAHFMAHNILIRIGEIVLFGGFIIHIAQGIALVIKNRKARPVQYKKGPGSSNSNPISRAMGPLGILILLFLVLHLMNFFAKAKIVEVGDGVQMVELSDGRMVRDLYTVVWASFGEVWYSLVYIVCMFPLAFHLYHGFHSAFQSLGWNHPKYTPIIKATGSMFSVVVPAAFASMPIYFLFLTHY